MAGTRCLPAASRRIASVGLWVLGLIYYYYYIGRWGNETQEDGTLFNPTHLSRLEFIGLTVGGLVAIIVTCLLWKKSQAIPPVIGKLRPASPEGGITNEARSNL